MSTGAAGGDATDLVGNPQLIGDVYVVPYTVLEPEHALVLDAGDRAVGYVVGALDTAVIEARLEEEWWPALRNRHPLGSGSTPLDEELIASIHRPHRTEPGVVERYPSHLHINVLSSVQGGGWGRRLMQTMSELLAADGSTGLHVGVDPANHRAAEFYLRLGFERLSATDGAQWFGIPLGD